MEESAIDSAKNGVDRLSQAFEHAAVGMALTDLNGRFLQTNAAYRQLLGRTSDELSQQTLLSLAHTNDRFQCQREIEQLRAGRSNSFITEKRYLRPDGKTVWLRNSIALQRAAEGRASTLLSICYDVSAQKRAEELLLESEKLAIIGRLASSIAHEINNPLESVINLLFLMRNSDTLEEARSYASEAEIEIARVADITKHTLQFHKEQATLVSADIVELLQSVLTLYRGKLNQAGIRVRFESEDTPHLVCFPGEIRQLLANLVRNAIEAIDGSGDLRIRVRPATDWRSGKSGVRITIADNGHGMSPEIRARIYDPFFTTKGSHGTGLGLWVTAGILGKHHGSMHVRSSTAQGASGTAFTLIFPHEGVRGSSANGGTAIAA